MVSSVTRFVFGLSSLAVLAPVSHARSFPRQVGLTVSSDILSPWTYQGCYIDVGRTLTSGGYDDVIGMTDESCVAYCSNLGYHYAGTEYFHECYCGDTLAVGGVLASPSDCSTPCAGDPTQPCGGGNRLTLFWDGQVPPVVNTGEDGWNSIGCYSEGTSGRALAYQYLPPDDTLMTVDICTTACIANEYNFAGLEYGDECWCGNDIENGGAPVLDSTGCDMLCPGNASEYCGAALQLEMYQFGGTARSTQSTSSSTSIISTTSTTSSIVSTSPVQAAASSSTYSLLVPTPSVQSSASSSTSSSIVPTSSIQSTTSSSTPSSSPMTVPQTLGIKQTVGDYTYQGCWTEGVGVRALTPGVYIDYAAMTLEECANACSAYTYFGVEYFGECYCGNSIDPSAGPAPNQADCDFICPGDQYEYCGAGDRLDMYMKGTTSGGTSSSSSSSSSASVTSSSSSASAAASTSSVSLSSSSSSQTSSSSASSGSSAPTSTSSSSSPSSSSSSSSDPTNTSLSSPSSSSAPTTTSLSPSSSSAAPTSSSTYSSSPSSSVPSSPPSSSSSASSISSSLPSQVSVCSASASTSTAVALVDLGIASTFAVLSYASITNTGPTIITGDIGTTGTSITGFPPGTFSGTEYIAGSAEAALTAGKAAFNQIEAMSGATILVGNLAGKSLGPGLYRFASSASLSTSGILSLVGTGSSTDTWIFQIGSTLIVGEESIIRLESGAQACNVYWQVGSSATLGMGSFFKGQILAAVSVTATTGLTVQGSLFGLGGSVTLNTNQVNVQNCSPSISTSTTCTILSTSSSDPSSSAAASTTSSTSSSFSSTSSAAATTSSSASSSSAAASTTSSSSLSSTASAASSTSSTLSSPSTSIVSSTSSCSSSLPTNYSLIGANPGGYVIDLIVTVDLSRPCGYDGALGYAITSLSGTYNNNEAVTFDPTQTTGDPDSCLYPSPSEIVDTEGFDFIAGSSTYKVHYLGNGEYAIANVGEVSLEINLVSPTVTCPAATTSSSVSSSSSSSAPSSSSSSAQSTSSSPSTTISSSSSSSSSSTSAPSSSCSVAPRPNNIIPDPSFEDTSSTAWHFIGASVTSSQSISGLYSAELTGSAGAYSIVYNFIPYTAYWGDTLYLSYAAKFTGSSAASCYFQALTGSSTIQEVDNLMTFDWQYFTATYSVQEGDESEGFAIAFMCSDPNAVFYVDDIYFGTAASAPLSGSCAGSTSSTSTSSTSAPSSTSTSASTSSSSDPPSSASSSSAPSPTSSSIDPSSTSSSAPSSSSAAAPSSTSSSVSSTTSSAATSTSSTTTSSAYTGPPTPSIVPSALNGDCFYIGCYSEATNTRALNSDALYNYNVGTGMTVEKCAAYCGNNYDMFGVEYSGECYCGNTLQSGSVILPATECDMVCDGAPLEFCGGPDRLNVYSCGATTSSSSSSVPATTSTSSSTTPSASVTSTSVTSTSSTYTGSPTPSIVPSAGGYEYIGCYTEAINSRALISSTYVNYNTMTIEMCASFCGPTYSLFGVEWSGECYCGNVLQQGSVQVADSQCNSLCDGNNLEYCGGGSRLNLYSAIAGTSTTSSTTTTPSATPSPTPASDPAFPNVGTYSYLGCQTEGTLTRALSGYMTAYDSMTLESCSADCKGYTYFGTEYGRECYCGNSFSAGSVPAPQDECTYPCAGNDAEICGAGLRLSVYATTVPVVAPPAAPTPSNPAVVGAYEYYSCMTEGANSRALQGYSTAYDSMTLESCAADCAGFDYFGTEYSRECYCGNSFAAGSVPAPESECQNTNFLCMGDVLEFCGGSRILSVYQLAPTKIEH